MGTNRTRSITLDTFGGRAKKISIGDKTPLVKLLYKYSLNLNDTRVNGSRVSEDYILKNGDIVVAVPQVKDGQ